MVIEIRDGSDVPIYLQLRNQIVAGISDGRLAPGSGCPRCGRWRRSWASM